MKIFLTICVVLLQLLGSNNVEAKPVVKDVLALSAKKLKQYYFSPAALHTDVPVENVHPQAGVSSLKIREQRFQLYASLSNVFQLLADQPKTSSKLIFQNAPAPIPISRLLLF